MSVSYYRIGRNIAAERNRAGLTQEEMAERIDRVPKYYADIERGSCGMSVETLMALSHTLNMPMDEDAQFVAVVGLFNRPDQKDNRWRLVLTRDDLDPDKPRTIELGDGWLSLVPVKE